MTVESAQTLADTGLGTTYERWALNRLLAGIQERYGIRSALEGPGDGMTGIAGINSIALARAGVAVTLHLPDASQAAYAEEVWKIYAPPLSLRVVTEPHPSFPDQAYDLVWNFNVLPRSQDPGALLEQMARISRRYVLFCVPNAGNYSFWLHRLHHAVAKQPWDHGDIAWMRQGPWLELLPRVGLRPCEVFYVDCPWWPDIVNPRQLVADFLPFLPQVNGGTAPQSRLRWEPEALPYYDPDRYAEVHRRMARLAFIEDGPLLFLKRLFGHHFGILAEKL